MRLNVLQGFQSSERDDRLSIASFTEGILTNLLECRVLANKSERPTKRAKGIRLNVLQGVQASERDDRLSTASLFEGILTNRLERRVLASIVLFSDAFRVFNIYTSGGNKHYYSLSFQIS